MDREMEAGGFARRQFSAARWRLIRREWWRIAAIVALSIAAVVAARETGGAAQLMAAMTFGFTSGVLFVLWLIGDVRALPWLWGAAGEEWTEEALNELNRSDWSVEHDVRRPRRGNWDHIATSRAGTFMIESKNFRERPE
jgi:Nuclease-related domain